MTNGIAQAAHWYARQTYGAVTWRQPGAAVVAVPLALRTVASRRFARGLLAPPVAAVVTVQWHIVVAGGPVTSSVGWRPSDRGLTAGAGQGHPAAR
jgi:hypothetical protein